MSVLSKHIYRTGFLKSEKWKTIRAAVLAAHNARCYICGVRSLQNDVHHVCYPKNVWETKVHECFPLCRKCHNLIHAEVAGNYTFKAFREATARIFERNNTKAYGEPIDTLAVDNFDMSR